MFECDVCTCRLVLSWCYAFCICAECDRCVESCSSVQASCYDFGLIIMRRVGFVLLVALGV